MKVGPFLLKLHIHTCNGLFFTLCMLVPLSLWELRKVLQHGGRELQPVLPSFCPTILIEQEVQPRDPFGELEIIWVGRLWIYILYIYMARYAAGSSFNCPVRIKMQVGQCRHFDQEGVTVFAGKS